MITIAICDDEEAHLEYTKSILLKSGINQSYKTIDYINPQKLLDDFVDNNLLSDIVILDIELGEDNGVMIAKNLFELNNTLEIIFLSAHQGYFQDVYFVNHVAFILKPIKQQYLENAIKKSIDNIINRNLSSITLICDGKKVIIRHNEITYLERKKRTTILHTVSNNLYQTYDTLDEILNKLNNTYFIRCHESYIINFLFIKSYKFNEFSMTNNDIIPISRKYKTIVGEQFNSFVVGDI